MDDVGKADGEGGLRKRVIHGGHGIHGWGGIVWPCGLCDPWKDWIGDAG